MLESQISIIFPRMQNMARVAQTCAGTEPNYGLQFKATTIDVNYANPLYLLFKALKLKYLVGYSMDFFPLVVEFIVD